MVIKRSCTGGISGCRGCNRFMVTCLHGSRGSTGGSSRLQASDSFFYTRETFFDEIYFLLTRCRLGYLNNGPIQWTQMHTIHSRSGPAGGPLGASVQHLWSDRWSESYGSLNMASVCRSGSKPDGNRRLLDGVFEQLWPRAQHVTDELHCMIYLSKTTLIALSTIRTNACHEINRSRKNVALLTARRVPSGCSLSSLSAPSASMSFIACNIYRFRSHPIRK